MSFLLFLPMLSVMMLVHELGHFVTARLFGITVQEFGFGLPPRVFGFKRGGVTYSLNLIPFGAFVKMLGEEDPTSPGSFASKSRLIRSIVLVSGAGMNFLLAILAFAVALMMGLPTISDSGPARFARVVPDSAAAMAGLLDGDTVIAVGGRPVNLGEFRQATRAAEGSPLSLSIVREKESFDTTVTPYRNADGQIVIGVFLGSNDVARLGPVEATVEGTKQAVGAIGLTLMLPKLLIDGQISPDDARPVGLPGMAQMTGEATDYAVETGFWYPIFMLTGMFSAGLAVANLLPIPALDGGRLLFVVIEGLRGRRVSPKREAAIHFAGIVLLLTLMLVITANDIRNPIPSVNWGLR